MKVFILLAVVAAVHGTVLRVAPVVAVGETGDSAQFRSEDSLGNYNFGYNEDHTSGGTFRREVGDAHGNVAGSYGLRDADGRVRIVNYIANDDGFKADIKTNEPGVEPKDPADATINKAESVILETAIPAVPIAPEPVVAIPVQSAPLYHAEQIQTSHIFPAASAVPIAKSVGVHQGPVTYTFPEVSAPVAKSVTTVTETRPAAVAYTFPEPAAVPIAKSIAVAEPAPLAYAFPAPAAFPVAKSIAVAEPAPLTYAFPAPALAPIPKTVTVAQSAPLTYAFPPAGPAPVANTVTVAQSAPLTYAFPPAGPAPVAKTLTVAQSAPLTYAFPPAGPAPVAKTLTVAEAAPLPYAFPARAAVPVAKSSLAYAPAPIALAESAPISKFAYSSEVIVNNAPGHYATGAVAYPAPLRYAASPYAAAYPYASPYYRAIYSPAVSTFAGPVPYFNNIEYHGYPVVKK